MDKKRTLSFLSHESSTLLGLHLGIAIKILESSFIYGSSRLGEYTAIVNMTTATVATTYFTRTRGKRKYELSNHLGNVQVVVSDRKVPQDTNADGLTDYYVADIVSATDYYAFGAVMPDRSFNAAGYRYGFNGKENDNEVKGTGNQQDYGMRIYDPRLGKFLSVDPLTMEYPELTPYQFASNSPINSIDLDGLEKREIIDAYKWAGGKVWDLAVGMVKGTAVLVAAQSNPVVAAHVGSQMYQSAKGTVKNVGTMASGGAKILYGTFTHTPINVDQNAFNEAAHNVGKGIVKTGATAVLTAGAAEGAQFVTKVKIRPVPKAAKPKINSLKDVKPLNVEEQTAVKGGHKSTEPDAQSDSNIKDMKEIYESGDPRQISWLEREPVHTVTINGETYILDGHHRIEAAKQAKYKIKTQNLSEKEASQMYPDKMKDIIDGKFKK